MSKSDKRKIIEIYVEENTEEDTVSFEFKKVENTEIANMTMKGSIMMFESQKSDEDELEVEYGQSRQ